MQIVQLSGGLGNQLFQYAHYLQLSLLDEETYIDDESCYQTDRDRNNQLEMVGISYKKAKNEDVQRLTDTSKKLISWMRRRITGSKAVIKNEGDTPTDKGYWIGYWQSAAYFKGIESKLRDSIFGENFNDEVIYDLQASDISSANAISLHIRRGDYLAADVQNVYGGICTDAYYTKAIDTMRKMYPGCVFYAFSNDPEWVKENYKDSDIVVMEGNDEEHGYRDMYLMSLCKHHILANSSFSWWGAWLNPNKNKTVVGPSLWIHREGFDGIYRDFPMLRITPNGELLNDK